MTRLLKHWVAEPSQCSYLPDRLASLEYRLMLDVSPEDLDELLERGWRRFGPAYFQPRCRQCASCVPLRIPVDDFRLSRSQRRVWNKAQRLRMTFGRPTIDAARIQLYERWHAARADVRGWEHDKIDAEQYFHQFAFPHPSAREIGYWHADRLVGVAITDETPRALSAVYTYYDPDEAAQSLGTASILFQLDLARRMQRRWVYLGYRVLGCPSSEYKRQYLPHELMTSWPSGDETGTWTRVTRDKL
ncbi:MAG: arginyltransferase [Myxococcales bacterium]|nr:arginyltransferase [Myxococcales bacterium]